MSRRIDIENTGLHISLWCGPASSPQRAHADIVDSSGKECLTAQAATYKEALQTLCGKLVRCLSTASNAAESEQG